MLTQTKTGHAPSADGAVRILVVDDVAVNQRILQVWLGKLGFRTEAADNGVEAVNKLTEGDPVDLVLMDCEMPVMDGFEATRRIRDREAALGLPRLPILAVTAGVGEATRRRCIEVGMDDYVAKPVSFPDLHARILHYLQRASGACAA